MIRLIVFLIMLSVGLFSAPVKINAADIQAEKGSWSLRTTQFVALSSFMAIDYKQSCDMFYGSSGYYEINPILGKNPSRQDMLAFGAAGMGILWLVSETLPESWATVVIDSVITSEQWNIEDNVHVKNGEQRRINAVPLIVTVRF